MHVRGFFRDRLTYNFKTHHLSIGKRKFFLVWEFSSLRYCEKISRTTIKYRPLRDRKTCFGPPVIDSLMKRNFSISFFRAHLRRWWHFDGTTETADMWRPLASINPTYLISDYVTTDIHHQYPWTYEECSAHMWATFDRQCYLLNIAKQNIYFSLKIHY